MARRAEGWKLVRRGRILRVRFTYKGERYEITTGESTASKAELVAAQIYADVVAGRVTVSESGTLVHPTTPLAQLCADWIIAIKPELGRDTETTYTVYARHWCTFFDVVGRLTTGNISNYGRRRLGSVTRKTVSKELSALRRFLLWAFDEGLLREAPEVRMPSKKALGVKHAQGRKAPTHLSPEQCEAIFAELPEHGRARGGRPLIIRDYFVFCYETALRPDGTVDHLEERDFTPLGLHIRPEVDKKRWERTVPLSDRAAAILRRLVTGVPGRPFFGARDRRDAWRKACCAALGPDVGNRVNPYDLKHARVTAWFSAGVDPMGVRFLTGTNEAIDKYALPSRAAAERALRGDSGAASSEESAKGGTRTPTGITPLAPQASEPERTGAKQADTQRRDSCESAITSSDDGLSGAVPRYADPDLFALFGAEPTIAPSAPSNEFAVLAFRAQSHASLIARMGAP